MNYNSRKKPSQVQTLQFINQLLLLDCIIPGKKDANISLLCPMLLLDTASLKPSQQIQLEHKQDTVHSEKSKALYERANRLEKFVKKGKSLLQLAYLEFSDDKQVSVNLSINKDHTISEEQIKDNAKNNSIQANIISISVTGRDTTYTPVTHNRKVLQSFPLNDENFNYTNVDQKELSSEVFSNKETGKLHFNEQKQIQQLRRPQYHLTPFLQMKKSMAGSRVTGQLQQRNKHYDLKIQPDSENQTFTALSLFKQQHKTSLIPKICQNFSKRNQHSDISVSPKVQRGKSVSPIKSTMVQTRTLTHIQEQSEEQPIRTSKSVQKVQQKKLVRSILESNHGLTEQAQKKYQQQSDKQIYKNRSKTQRVTERHHSAKGNKTQEIEQKKPSWRQIQVKYHQQESKLQNYLTQYYPHRRQEVSIYVQTDSIQREEDKQSEKRSLDLLNKIVQKTNKSFSELGKQITGIKEAISELGESRMSQRQKQRQRQKQKQSQQEKRTSNLPQSRNNQRGYQHFSQPHTVQEQQMWECEEDQLQQQIKRINQQLTSKNHQKTEERVICNQKQRVSIPNQTRNQVQVKKQARSSLITNPQRNLTVDSSSSNLNQTKRVQLNLTPERILLTPNNKQNSFNIEIDILKIEGMESHYQNERNRRERQLIWETPKQDIYTQSKTISHNNLSEIHTLPQQQCAKWKKSKKKQLLSMKIANLRD